MATSTSGSTGTEWSTWVWIKWKQGAPEDVLSSWKGSKWFKGGWSTTGSWDAILWLDSTDPTTVEKAVWSEIRSNKWVETTETGWAKKSW